MPAARPISSVVLDFTAPYNRVEAWVYDKCIAPAVHELARESLPEIVGESATRGSLLDVGCGGGQIALTIAEALPGLDITGVDLSPEMIERARARAASRGASARFVVGSALSLPFAAETFDTVISIASIKHWPDPRRGLSECARVLRQGGSLTLIELSHDCQPEERTGFVARWRVPPFLRPLAIRFFERLVVSRAPSLEQLREWAQDVPLEDTHLERKRGTPALILRGRKR